MEENCSKLLCINTNRGLYKFNRLAFGVKVASWVPCWATLISQLDDILITSNSVTEHRKHIICVFDQLQEYGFKVREAKCEFFLSEIKYLRHIINKDGRRPDPDWATAIKDMPAPDNVQTLQRFLGLANFNQIFIKNMHNLRAPLNELLKKDKTWRWTPECQAAFEKIKETLTSDLSLSLTHYDPKFDMIVASDARSYGIGACILHKPPDVTRKVIAHASRSFLPAEK